MARKARILMHGIPAGILTEDSDGFSFVYFTEYLQRQDAVAVSLTLPLSEENYKSQTMFSFFDGLIPEGWLLDITVETWKIDPRDRMGLLLACCRDCIGAVSVIRIESEE